MLLRVIISDSRELVTAADMGTLAAAAAATTKAAVITPALAAVVSTAPAAKSCRLTVTRAAGNCRQLHHHIGSVITPTRVHRNAGVFNGIGSTSGGERCTGGGCVTLFGRGGRGSE